jgi:hypothetical protein
MIDDEKAIGNLITGCAFELPESFLSFHRQYGAIKGELRIPPYWFQLWPVSDLLQANRNYQVQEFLAGWFAFGSSGGGEMLAFDAQATQPWKVYRVPFIGMDESQALFIAEDFTAFVQAINLVNP